MPEPADLRAAVDRYLDAWNSEDRAAWVACFADDAVSEDPVGSEPMTGHEAIGAFWDNIHSMIEGAKLNKVLGPILCGNEVVFAMQGTGSAGGNEVQLDIIDYMRFDDDGKIASLRAFWTM